MVEFSSLVAFFQFFASLDGLELKQEVSGRFFSGNG